MEQPKLNMHTRVIKEAGYEEALLGLSLSFNADLERMPKQAEKLAPLDKGHNKCLESIAVWLDVRAPRYWGGAYRPSPSSPNPTSRRDECSNRLKTVDNSGKYITVFSIYNPGGEIVKKGVIPAIVVLIIVFWPFIQRFYKEMNPTPQEVTIQGIVNVEKARMMIKLNRQIVRKYGVNAYSKSELSWAEGIMEQYGEPY